jgi:phosphate transport system substrate-binding protein
MKTQVCRFPIAAAVVTAAALALAPTVPAADSPPTPAKGKTTLSLSGAWALYPMAVRWGEEYQKLHPDIQCDISAGGAGKGLTDALAGAVDIGMVSRDVTEAEVQKGALAVAMVKDAVVPVVNTRNPELAILQKQGVKQATFAGIWMRQDVPTWGTVTGTEQKAPLRAFTRSDACGAAETWAKYLGGKQEQLKGTGVYGDPGLAEAVRKDPLAIGYNNVNFAYDPKTHQPIAGLAVLPIDVNGDGTIGPDENFYKDRESLLKAIAEGRYPSPPARELFFVTKGKPQNPAVAAFIEWALTQGQAVVPEAGYINLSKERLDAEIKKIKP